jgi:glutamine cyclotransferase
VQFTLCCAGSSSASLPSEPTTAGSLPIDQSDDKITRYHFKVVQSWPHDPNAFTQGLFFQGGFLYESTGLVGASTLRKIELSTGKVLQKVPLNPTYFGEGMTIIDGKIYQLTWLERKGLIYDLATLTPIGEFPYKGEGWGLTHDNDSLIMSDGTEFLQFLDPKTFSLKRHLRVLRNEKPVIYLNELEYIKGEVWANVWQTNEIVRINPETGAVTGIIDLTGILRLEPGAQSIDVLNGIAYDAQQDRLLVTGKLWPKIFEIKLVPLDKPRQ